MTGNRITRLLVGDDCALPIDSFISVEAHSVLFEKALQNLRAFSFVGFVEDPELPAELLRWLGEQMTISRDNETPTLHPDLYGDLAVKLTPESMNLLKTCNAIDL